MGIASVLGLVAFGLIAWIAMKMKEGQLADPENTTVLETGQIGSHMLLTEGEVEAILLRQSGGVYRDLGVFASPALALAEVQKSFRRAGISAVYMRENSADRLRIVRLHHSHRGSSEGKKLGGAAITLL